MQVVGIIPCTRLHFSSPVLTLHYSQFIIPYSFLVRFFRITKLVPVGDITISNPNFLTALFSAPIFPLPALLFS